LISILLEDLSSLIFLTPPWGPTSLFSSESLSIGFSFEEPAKENEKY
jgi:hypothetical protein